MLKLNNIWEGHWWLVLDHWITPTPAGTGLDIDATSSQKDNAESNLPLLAIQWRYPSQVEDIQALGTKKELV